MEDYFFGWNWYYFYFVRVYCYIFYFFEFEVEVGNFIIESFCKGYYEVVEGCINVEGKIVVKC